VPYSAARAYADSFGAGGVTARHVSGCYQYHGCGGFCMVCPTCVYQFAAGHSLQPLLLSVLNFTTSEHPPASSSSNSAATHGDGSHAADTRHARQLIAGRLGQPLSRGRELHPSAQKHRALFSLSDCVGHFFRELYCTLYVRESVHTFNTFTTPPPRGERAEGVLGGGETYEWAL